MNDEPMRDEQMRDEFRARMRQGLASMAVRERVRERARNRAIAGGALAAVVLVTAGVFGVQAVGGNAERDQAAPPTPSPTVVETPAPTATEPAATEPAETDPPETDPAEPTPPPGFEGVAAGEPIVTGSETCDGCGDAGATGDYRAFLDVVVLCESAGAVTYNGLHWIDCTTVPAGTGVMQVALPLLSDEPDPVLEGVDGFTGELQVVPHGQPVPGDAGGASASVYYDCDGWGGGVPITVGGTVFDCSSEAGERLQLAAWGVPIPAGQLVPTLSVPEGTPGAQLRFVVER